MLIIFHFQTIIDNDFSEKMETKLYYIYQLRAENEPIPFYIGKGTGNRCMNHFSDWALKARSYKNSRIKYYWKRGITIVIEMLYESTCEESIFEMEIFLIALYGRVDIGTGYLTNHTNGGKVVKIKKT